LIINGMGGRVVEGSGLENRRTCKRTVGSNPTPSAIRFVYRIDLFMIPRPKGTCAEIAYFDSLRAKVPCSC
jgi:hypothetical protein